MTKRLPRNEELGMSVQRAQLFNLLRGAAQPLRLHLLKMTISDDERLRASWCKEIVAKYLNPLCDQTTKPFRRKPPMKQYRECLGYRYDFQREWDAARREFTRPPLVDPLRFVWQRGQLPQLIRHCAVWLSGPLLDGDPHSAARLAELRDQLITQTRYHPENSS